MKQIYTIALAACVALTASAGELTVRTLNPVKKNVKATAITMVKKELPAMATMNKAPQKAEAASIEGEYTFSIGDYYFQSSVGDTEETVTVTLADGVVTITPDASSEFFMTPVSAAYDAATGELTFSISKDVLSLNVQGTTYYTRFESFKYVEDPTTQKGSLVTGEFKATYADGKVTFPADHGFSWPAYTDEACTQRYAYFALFDALGMEKSAEEPENPNEGWKSVGNATLYDPWLLPAFDILEDAAENGYAVELQQNEKTATLYRLVNPYKGECPVAQYNTCTKNGYIEFDIADPEHVWFNTTEAGFANSQLGVTKFYPSDLLSSLALGYDMTAADVIEILGDKLTYTTYKDGVVTLGSRETTDKEGNPMTEYAACFGIQGEQYGAYGWTDVETEEATPMTGKIVFPGAGVSNLGVENSGKARYFNLQGVELARPAAGQVVIRVCDGKSVKMLAK